MKTLLLSLLSTALVCSSHAEEIQPPNLIFILSDDLAQGDLGCYGQKLIQTPNLDKMAAEGTLYHQAYSGTSVCAPSRSSLMTGLHMGHCPVRANREIKPEGQLPLPAETVTVAQLLKQAGYATAAPASGAWACSTPPAALSKKASTASSDTTASATPIRISRVIFMITKSASRSTARPMRRT